MGGLNCSMGGRTGVVEDISSMMDRQASSSWRSQLFFSSGGLNRHERCCYIAILESKADENLYPIELDGRSFRLALDDLLFLERPRPRRFFLSRLSSRVLSKAASSRQNPPLPGSSLERAILMKHLFSERLCRIEFYA